MTTAIRTKWLVLVTIGVLLAAGAIAWAFFAIPPSSLPMTIGGSSAGQLLQAAQDNNAKCPKPARAVAINARAASASKALHHHHIFCNAKGIIICLFSFSPLGC